MTITAMRSHPGNGSDPDTIKLAGHGPVIGKRVPDPPKEPTTEAEIGVAAGTNVDVIAYYTGTDQDDWRCAARLQHSTPS